MPIFNTMWVLLLHGNIQRFIIFHGNQFANQSHLIVSIQTKLCTRIIHIYLKLIGLQFCLCMGIFQTANTTQRPYIQLDQSTQKVLTMNPTKKKTKFEEETDWNSLITCGLSTLKSTLDQYGVAILPAVLMEKEQEILGDGIKNHFLNICPELNLKDPKTWKLQLQGLFLSRGMLCQHFNSGHIKEIWDLRANPKIMKAYQTLYSGEDLIVSYDGCAFSLPPEYTGIGWHRK